MGHHFFSSQQYVYPIIDSRDFYVNSILAIITFLAVLVALFQEYIKKLWSRAKIKIEITKAPPDCHQIMLTNQVTGANMGYTYYFRIRIINESSTNSAQNVEGFITNFWEVDKNEKHAVKSFLPMNLKWSHTGEIKTTVLPNFYRHLDFGSFRRKSNNSVFLLLDTIVQPNPVAGGVVPNIIEPGNYEFEVVVSGENISPQRKRWSLEFKNKWEDNEEKMLAGISIREIGER